MSASLTICSIPDELKTRLRQFRFAKSEKMNALIVKVDKQSQELKEEEFLEDCDLEDVCNELPEQQPRFILLSFARSHSDGRTSYPMCLIFFSPSGSSPDLLMLYAGSRNTLVGECDLTKNLEVRDIEELTQEYIDSKI